VGCWRRSPAGHCRQRAAVEAGGFLGFRVALVRDSSPTVLEVGRVGFSPTSEIDGGGAQHIGGGSPHPSG
jgi:hypothetical protein